MIAFIPVCQIPHTLLDHEARQALHTVTYCTIPLQLCTSPNVHGLIRLIRKSLPPSRRSHSLDKLVVSPPELP